MYMITMQSLIISPKMSSIIAWNVTGELHIPKNITVGSKSPLFVLKAAFHWSPSTYSSQMSPLLKQKLLCCLPFAKGKTGGGCFLKICFHKGVAAFFKTLLE